MRPMAFLEAASASLLSLVALATLGGCTQSAPNGLTNSASARYQTKGDPTDFMYDATVDQIAYMSCSNMPTKSLYNRNTYFSLRTGSYRNSSGLRLKDAFFDEHAGKSLDKMADLLAASANNSFTTPQMAVRPRAALQSALRSDARQEPEQDIEFMNMLSLVTLGATDMNRALTDIGWNFETLQKSGNRLRYIRNGDVRGARMEASLYFTDNNATANGLRSKLMHENHVLALTFSEDPGLFGNAYSARSPGTLWPDKGHDVNRKAYGRGFRLSFARPSTTSKFILPLNYGSGQNEFNDGHTLLVGVTEELLNDPGGEEAPKPWVCPDTMRFRIIRAEDAKRAGCEKKIDPATIDPNSTLGIVRNSFRVEDWYVDTANGCLIPKRPDFSCYGNHRYVNYGLASQPTTDAQKKDPKNSCSFSFLNTSETAQACVEFASVCHRP